MIDFNQNIKTPFGDMHPYEVEWEHGHRYIVRCTDKNGLKHEFLMAQVEQWNKTPAQELVDQGYFPVSNNHRLLKRIDRVDWLQEMARRMNLSVADFYKHDGTLRHWGEHYCRVYSQDIKTVDAETYRDVKQLWGGRDPTFVEPAVTGHERNMQLLGVGHRPQYQLACPFKLSPDWESIVNEYNKLRREHSLDLRRQRIDFVARMAAANEYRPVAMQRAVEKFATVTPKPMSDLYP